MNRLAIASTLALLLGCGGSAAPARSVASVPDVVLHDAAADAPLAELVKRRPLTVLVFYAPDCPVQKAHDARLRELVATYEVKGVTFAAVLSEAGADVAEERAEVIRRGLAIPVLEDRGAVLADALGVEYSTHSVLLDGSRKVLYSGALDGERTHLTDKGEPYLKIAIDDAIAGRPVAKAKVEPLGCPLKKH